MPLPLTANTSYVANSTPVIAALDLNQIQQFLAGLYAGLYTVKSLTADGTGGNAGSLPAGLLRGSGLVTSTTAPTPVTYPAGTVGQGTVARGWAVVNADGTLARGYNVYSCGRTPAGAAHGGYTIVFDSSPSDPANACVWVTLMQYQELITVHAVPENQGGRVAVRVLVVEGAGIGIPTDSRISVGIFAE